MTKLEQRAMEYLKAMEGDDDQKLAEADRNLKDAAILWAQGYAIEQVEKNKR